MGDVSSEIQTRKDGSNTCCELTKEAQLANRPKRRSAGRIAALAGSFEGSPKQVESGHGEAKPQQSSSSVLERAKRFSTTSEECLPLEFGIHVTTSKNLDELTRVAKNRIWISEKERRKRMSTEKVEGKRINATEEEQIPVVKNVLSEDSAHSPSCSSSGSVAEIEESAQK